MEFYDFEYDGVKLSELGYTLCEFGGNGEKTISNGSKLSFNTVSTLFGQKNELVSTTYSECIGTKLQICKIPCDYTADYHISVEDISKISRWLNRKGFYKLKFMCEGYSDLYFEASFNINQIKIGGYTCGLELEVVTNRPYALAEERVMKYRSETPDWNFFIYDMSDEEGITPVIAEIKILSDGDLIIDNSTYDKRTKIINCVAEEEIIMDNPIISSSVPEHKIQNDFNYNFMRIYNSFDIGRKNDFFVSLPCEITIKYNPVVKIGI